MSDFALKVKQVGEAVQALERLPDAMIQISPREALCLLGSIQLSLRHPKNTGPCSEVAREFGRRLQEYLSQGGPAIAAICDMGWHPKDDVEG